MLHLNFCAFLVKGYIVICLVRSTTEVSADQVNPTNLLVRLHLRPRHGNPGPPFLPASVVNQINHPIRHHRHRTRPPPPPNPRARPQHPHPPSPRIDPPTGRPPQPRPPPHRFGRAIAAALARPCFPGRPRTRYEPAVNRRRRPPWTPPIAPPSSSTTARGKTPSPCVRPCGRTARVIRVWAHSSS
jgi:hypothetical protein